MLQTDEDLRTGMYKVLEHLRNHSDAWAFLDPVEEGIAPNYYAVIRRPMHITKVVRGTRGNRSLAHHGASLAHHCC